MQNNSSLHIFCMFDWHLGRNNELNFKYPSEYIQHVFLNLKCSQIFSICVKKLHTLFFAYVHSMFVI